MKAGIQNFRQVFLFLGISITLIAFLYMVKFRYVIGMHGGRYGKILCDGINTETKNRH